MDCPLNDDRALDLVRTLGERFDTLDFMAACPRGPGNREGSACAHVGGRRGECGKRVAALSKSTRGKVSRVGTGSPARWLRHDMPNVVAGGGAVDPPRVETAAQTPVAAEDGGSSWVSRERARQIRWKEDVAGVAEQGEHNGVPRPFLFPRERWQENVLPTCRDSVARHVLGDVTLHGFVHHVLSSQAFALNLAGPFFDTPALLAPTLRALLHDELAADLESVESVEAELVDPENRFREPGSRGTLMTSVDLGITWRGRRTGRALLLVEVKYTESGFGECKKGGDTGGACDSDGPGIVASGGALCPLSGDPHRRTYWEWLNRLGVFRSEALAVPGPCPFRHGGYQLMRNQTLAAVLEQGGYDRVDFAVLLHDGNVDIRRSAALIGGVSDPVEGWRSLLADPSRFHCFSAREWVDAASDPALGAWRESMLARYFPDSPMARLPAADGASALRPGHWRAAEWLGTPDFAAIKATYDDVCGLGATYFRVVNGKVNAIALHPKAPGYVGHRANADDAGHVLQPTSAPPTREELRRRHAAFERWLPTVKRRSAEERAVIPWLRAALRHSLALPELGEGWVFLNQEWRFPTDDGKGCKTDVLAVHTPTGQLGIVEAKESANLRSDAERQVREYGALWRRHSAELAPFFSKLLTAAGGLYGNRGAAATVVAEGDAALFVAWPGIIGMRAERVQW